jgi:hypothetical protein
VNREQESPTVAVRVQWWEYVNHSPDITPACVILVSGHWLVVIGHWLVVIGHWLVVIGHFGFGDVY